MIIIPTIEKAKKLNFIPASLAMVLFLSKGDLSYAQDNATHLEPTDKPQGQVQPIYFFKANKGLNEKGSLYNKTEEGSLLPLSPATLIAINPLPILLKMSKIRLNGDNAVGNVNGAEAVPGFSVAPESQLKGKGDNGIMGKMGETKGGGGGDGGIAGGGISVGGDNQDNYAVKQQPKQPNTLGEFILRVKRWSGCGYRTVRC